MRLKLEIDDDEADRIVVAALRRSRELLRDVSPDLAMGDEKELRTAMAKVIRYFSPAR